MFKKSALIRVLIALTLALFSGFVFNYCVANAAAGQNPAAEGCQNRTGFVICIPDGFRL